MRLVLLKAADSQWNTWPTFVCGATAGCEAKNLLDLPHTVQFQCHLFVHASIRSVSLPYATVFRRFRSRHPSLTYVTAGDKRAHASVRCWVPRAYMHVHQEVTFCDFIRDCFIMADR